MERVHGTRKTSEIGSEDDVISSIPEDVITNILNRLQIRDAVRTGILSTSWRCKWTMLTKLRFDDELFDSILKAQGTRNNWRNVIRFLLHLRGPITKFVLEIHRYSILNEDVSDWFLLLSAKGIKEVTLHNFSGTPLELPTYLFSCLHLKHLDLVNCYIHVPPNFNGFPNLLSLNTFLIGFETGNCGELISRSPLLEKLRFCNSLSTDSLKLVDFAKLVNLKFLYLALRCLDNAAITSSSIFQLLGFFPKLQELQLSLWGCKSCTEAGARKRVPTSFPCLKILDLAIEDLDSDIMLSFAFEMIWSSPNLQTLKITGMYTSIVVPPSILPSEVDYDTMGQLQLQSVVFEDFRGLKNEICLVKYLLARSPLLKKMEIHFETSVVSSDSDKFEVAKKLLELHRASPIAEIKLI